MRDLLQHHVTGAIERGEATAIVEQLPICGCEHVRHDTENVMPDVAPEIPRDGHPMHTPQPGAHPHAYVGDVCTTCHTTCFGEN